MDTLSTTDNVFLGFIRAAGLLIREDKDEMEYRMVSVF